MALDGVKLTTSPNQANFRPRLGLKHHMMRPSMDQIRPNDDMSLDFDSDDCLPVPPKRFHEASTSDKNLRLAQFDAMFGPNPIFNQIRKLKRKKEFEPSDIDSPLIKQRMTEEKMAARLRNFHISNDLNQSQKYLGERPQETFDEIERRLSLDSDEELDKDEAYHSLNSSGDQNSTFEMLDELKSYVKQKIDERLLKPQILPNPCTDIVLWQSPGTFIENILPKPKRKDLLESLRDNTYNHSVMTSDTPLVQGLDATCDNADTGMEID